jgi:HEAT repeat protein
MKVIISMLLGIAISVAASPAADQPSDISTFVHQIYIEGIPYEEAIRFDPASAVPILLGMLADPKEEEYWPNIVVTLGMLGDERAVDPLIQFMKEDAAGPLSHSRYKAKTSVVMALGYIVNKNGSKKALEFLIESVDPAVWTRRGIMWKSPYHRTEAERNQQLTIMSILGLGLSGNREALTLLRSLRQVPATRQGENLRAQIAGVNDVLKEAIAANEKIAKRGMADYYR